MQALHTLSHEPVTQRTAVASLATEVATLHALIEPSNPLFSLEKNLRNKLVQIGMIDDNDKLLFDFATPNKLNDSQIAKIIQFLKENEIIIANEEQRTFLRLNQQVYFIRYQQHLPSDKLCPTETYLSGALVDDILDPISQFCEMVRIFLREKGEGNENLLDKELEELQKKQIKRPLNLTEWFYDIPNLDSASVQDLENFHLSWLAKEVYFPLSDNEEEAKALVKQHCVLNIQKEEDSLVITLGDKSKKNAGITTIRIGAENSPFSIHDLKIPLKDFIIKCNEGKPLPNVYPVSSDYYQTILDKALGFLNPKKYKKLRPISLAQTAYYLSQNFCFPTSERYSQLETWKNSQPEEAFVTALQTIQRQYNCNPVALAYAASSCLSNNAAWSLLGSDMQSGIFSEINRLIVEKNLPLKAIHSLLCFASWTRICHPFEQKDFKISINQKRIKDSSQLYFILNFENTTLEVPLKPKSYAKTLLSLNLAQLEEMQTLWKLLVPQKITKVGDKPLFRKFFGKELSSIFMKMATELVKHNSPFLNHIGYTCVLASQGILEGPFFLDEVFRKLPNFLSDDSERIAEQLQLLSSLYTPQNPFIPKHNSKITIIIEFSRHLLKNKKRFQGITLLDTAMHHFNASSVPLFEIILEQSFDDRISFYKKYERHLTVTQQESFFYTTIGKISGKEHLPYILKLANILVPPSKATPDRQEALLDFYRTAVKYGYIEQVQQLLVDTANYFEQSNWEKGALTFCDSLLENKEYGLPGILKAWNVFSKIRQFPIPEVLKVYQIAPKTEKPIASKSEEPIAPTSKEPIAPKLKESIAPKLKESIAPTSKEPIASKSEEPIAPKEEVVTEVLLTETTLQTMTPLQIIKAVQEGLCEDIPITTIKEIHTKSIIALFDQEPQLLPVHFAKYSFTEDNCYLEQVHKKLLAYLQKPLPRQREVLYFQDLIALVKSPTFLKVRETFFEALLKRFAELNHISEVKGKEQVSLNLLEMMLQENSSHSVELLSLMWTKNSDAKIKRLLKAHNNALFSYLVENDFYKEALELLKFLEIHKVEPIKAISKDRLLTLFTVVLTKEQEELDSIYLRLKFVVRSCFGYSKEALPILLQCVPLLNQHSKREECEKMLLTCLNKLKSNELEKYYPNIIKALGEKKETFHFLCSIANKNSEQIFQFALKLFPQMDPLEYLSMLEERHAIFKSATPSMLQSMEELLYKIAQTKCELVAIFNFLDVISYWPISLLEKIRVLRASEQHAIFAIIYSLELKGTFSLSNRDKKTYCYTLLHEIFKTFPNEILRLTYTIDKWKTLLETNHFEELSAHYFRLVLENITDPENQISELQALTRLRNTISTLPDFEEKMLIETLIKSRNSPLLQSAIQLASNRFKDLQSIEVEEFFRPTLAKLLGVLPLKCNVNNVLPFLNMLYVTYPDVFNQEAKSYLFNRMLTYLPEEKKASFNDYSDAMQIETLFFSMIKKFRETELKIGQHYIANFIINNSLEQSEILSLILIIGELQTALQTTDTTRIYNAIDSCIRFFNMSTLLMDKEAKVVFLSNTKLNEIEKIEAISADDSIEDLFSGAVHACCSAITRIHDLKDEKLFILILSNFFNCLKQKDSENSDIQKYYLILIDYLFTILPYNELIENVIQSCITKLDYLAPIHMKKFERILLRIFNFPPKEHFDLYMQVWLTLTHIDNPDIREIKTIYEWVVTYYGKGESPTDCDLLHAFANKILLNVNSRIYLDIYYMFLHLQPMFNSNTKPLIHCYELFFDRLTFLNFYDMEVLLKPFTQELLKSPSHELLTNELFVLLYQQCMPKLFAHFKNNKQDLLKIGATLLALWAKEKKVTFPHQFTLALNVLKPFNIEYILEEIDTKKPEESDYITNLFEKFETKPSLWSGDLLKEIFDFMNNYIIELLPQHPQMSPYATKVLTNATQSLGYLLCRKAFDKIPSTLLLLLKMVVPSTIKVIQTELMAGRDAKDYICSILFSKEIQNNPNFNTAKLSAKQVNLAIFYIRELLSINHPKAFAQGEQYFSDIRLLLRTLVKCNGDLDFSIFIKMIHQLVPCNVSFIKAQLQQGMKPIDHLSELLFVRNTRKPSFMNAPNIIEKFKVLHSFCKELFSLDNEEAKALGSSIVLKNKNLLLEFLSKSTFSDNFDAYLACVCMFIPSNIAIIKVQLEAGQSTITDLISSFIFEEQACKATPKDPSFLQKKISVAIAFITALLGVDFPEKNDYRSSFEAKILKMIKDLHSQEHIPDYLNSVKDFMAYNIVLIKKQILQKHSLSDYISSLLPDNLNVSPHISKKMSILGSYAAQLIGLKDPKAVEIGNSIFLEGVHLLKTLRLSNSFKNNTEYFNCVSAFIQANLALQSINPGQDYIYNLLFSEPIYSVASMEFLPLRTRITHSATYMHGLIEIGNDKSLELSKKIWGQLYALLSKMPLTKQNIDIYLDTTEALMATWVKLLRVFAIPETDEQPIFNLLFESTNSIPEERKASFLQRIYQICLPHSKALLESEHATLREQGNMILVRAFLYLKGAFSSKIFQKDYSVFMSCVKLVISANIAAAKVEMIRGDNEVTNCATALLFGPGTDLEGFSAAEYFKERYLLHNSFAQDLILLDYPLTIKQGMKILDYSYNTLHKMLCEKYFNRNFNLYLSCVETMLPANITLFRISETFSDSILLLLFNETATQPEFKSYDIRRRAIVDGLAKAIGSLPVPSAEFHSMFIRNTANKYFSQDQHKKSTEKKKESKH